jgi:hypothetical protein
MDILQKYAEMLSKGRPGQAPLTDGGSPAIMALMANRPKPKLETEMEFDGADIAVSMDEPKVQDMAETVIQADAPPMRENKFGPLNRNLALGQMLIEQTKPNEERMASINSQLAQLKAKQDRPQRLLDLSDIQERMKVADQKSQGEWSGDDYLKAALVAALPALAGALVGGGAGAANATPNAGGGSGIVILKYASSLTITIGAGLTGSTTTSGSNTIATITAGTGNVSWA